LNPNSQRREATTKPKDDFTKRDLRMIEDDRNALVANIHNDSRPIMDQLLRKNKLSKVDVAQAEAAAINEELSKIEEEENRIAKSIKQLAGQPTTKQDEASNSATILKLKTELETLSSRKKATKADLEIFET
jgi:outer membrane protein TolC